MWGAYVTHLLATTRLAPGRGHPAHLYRSLPSIDQWTIQYPQSVIGKLREQDASEVALLLQDATEVAGLVTQLRLELLGARPEMSRASACLAAARRLLEISEQRL